MSHNAYSQFKHLLGTGAVTIVTITSVRSDGSSLATTTSGITVVVGGDSVAVGQKAFVKDGIIQRQAPNFSFTRYEV